MRTSWLAILVAGCAPSDGANAPGAPDAPDAPVVLTHVIDATRVQCPFGGSAVQSGIDANGNGVLDASEVQVLTVLCAPEPAAPTVLRIVDQPAGPQCAVGGTAVESGPDRNGNHVLDDDEVAHVDYICRDVVIGDLAIYDKAKVPAFANVRAITGSLTISVSVLSPVISLPKLQQVGGSMTSFSSYHIAFPELTQVGGNLLIVIAGSAEFPKLARVGSLSIFNAILPDLSGFPALRFADSLSVGASSVVSVDLSLDTVRSVRMNGDGKLATVHLQVAHAVDDLDIDDNGGLTSLALDMPSVGKLTIQDNHQLPSCQVQAIVDRLHPVTATISGNDDNAPCDP